VTRDAPAVWEYSRIMLDRLVRLRAVFAALFLPALLGPGQLLIFGPFTTYQHNRAEFLASFWSIAPVWLWLLAAVTGALVAGGLALRPAARTRYIAALFAIGLLLWAQGNLLVAGYGPLYGERLDFGPHDWRTPWEIALWVLVPLAFVWLARPVAAVAPVASGVLIGLQAIVLAVAAASPAAPAEASDTVEWRTPHDRVYRLSSERNVIHVVLDGFLSEVFGEIVKADPEGFDRDLAGFTFFEDHLGAFPTTRASMPAMLSGMQYRNERPFDAFQDEAHGRSIFTALHRAGYRLTAVTFHGGELPPRAQLRTRMTRYGIPTPYGTEAEYLRFAAAQLLDLTLFRHVPQLLKPAVYNDEAWLIQRWSSGEIGRGQAVRNARPSNHLLFLEDFGSQLEVAGPSPVYLFIHLAVPHPPVVVDGECNFVGQQKLTRETYAAQARCAVTVVRRFFGRIRELGLYDSSVIVLTSDHGWNVRRPDHPFAEITSPAGPMYRVVLSAMPLLAVKPIGATGPFRTSAAPTAIADLPATILALAGVEGEAFPGHSVIDLEAGTPRARTYAYHSWQDADWQRPYLELLHVFTVEGRVVDPAGWRFDRTIFEPAKPLERQLIEKRSGLSAVQRQDGEAFRQGEAHAVVYAPRDARALELRIARSPRATRGQTLTVRIDGRPAATRHVDDYGWHGLTVPLRPRQEDGPPFTIELITAPPAYDEDGRPLGFRYAALDWKR